MIRVDVIVDLEPVADGRRLAWWATAPAIGNFAVAADSLRELETLARAAIDEIAQEQGEVAEIAFTLRNDAPVSAGAIDPGVTLELSAESRVGVAALEATVPGTDVVQGNRVSRELVAA